MAEGTGLPSNLLWAGDARSTSRPVAPAYRSEAGNGSANRNARLGLRIPAVNLGSSNR